MERLFEMKNTIDDSPRVVARHFLKTMRPQKKTAKIDNVIVDNDVKVKETLPPVATKKIKAGDLRTEAFALFEAGKGATEVRDELNITYANAHYYLRAFRKSNKS